MKTSLFSMETLPSRCIILGADLCLETGILEDHALVIQDGMIQEIRPAETFQPQGASPTQRKASLIQQEISYRDDQILTADEPITIIPGMLDLHLHGSLGADVMDGTLDALKTIQQGLFDKGVTGFLATTMTASESTLTHALRVVHQASLRETAHADILGVHLEGPFLSQKRMGAQRGDLIQDPDLALFDRLQAAAGGLIRKVTLAPERPNSLALIQHLTQQGVISSIGHTDATSEETRSAIDAGATQATHLFNAMKGIHHRDPGPITAILLDDRVAAELILDGHHLAPDIVKLVLKIKGAERVILVTDAMRAQCMSSGAFELGGQPVTVENGEARLANGVLAGSVLTMNHALFNLVNMGAASLHEAVYMASTVPAKLMGWHDRGRLAPGHRADLVCLNSACEVRKVFKSATQRSF